MIGRGDAVLVIVGGATGAMLGAGIARSQGATGWWAWACGLAFGAVMGGIAWGVLAMPKEEPSEPTVTVTQHTYDFIVPRESLQEFVGCTVRFVDGGSAPTNRYDPESKEPLVAPWKVIVEGQCTGWRQEFFRADAARSLLTIAGWGDVDASKVEVVL